MKLDEKESIRAGLAFGYQLGKHRRDAEHCKLSYPQQYFLPQLDEMHPKTNTPSCLGTVFALADMLFVHCSSLPRSTQCLLP